MQIVEPEEMHQKANASTPHTTHCLASGEIMISTMGDRNKDGRGGQSRGLVWRMQNVAPYYIMLFTLENKVPLMH